MRGTTFTVRNALIYDGTGAEPVVGDVAVVDGTIAEKPGRGPDLDAMGLALSPGFIDSHAYDDHALIVTDLVPKISQGVTTVVTGNRGISLAPLVLGSPPSWPLGLLGDQHAFSYATFAEFAARIRLGASVNAACLVGLWTLRAGTVDRLDRPANPGEIEIMKAKLRASLAAGAIGLSTGFEPPPAKAVASPEEIEALAAVCGAEGAIYASNMRDEGNKSEESLQELLAIGRRAHAAVVISHHLSPATRDPERSAALLALIADAQTRQDIGFSVYPYDACSTILRPELLRGSKRVIVTRSGKYPRAAGRDLADLAREWSMPLDKTANRLAPAGAIYFDMDEVDLQRFLAFPDAMIGSYGLLNDAHPHPRLWGSFPRFLGHYARDIGLFPFAEAIRRVTTVPARRFGLKGRGRIAPGFHADLVLFDPAIIADKTTYADPKRPAHGIAKVWVNGSVVWDGNRATTERAGTLLRREVS
jgi:N-acyl-D-amino-acid deacylase